MDELMAWAEANMWESHTVLKAANAKTSGAEEHVSHTPIEPVGASIAPAPAPAFRGRGRGDVEIVQEAISRVAMR